jgi:hypothetical protein
VSDVPPPPNTEVDLEPIDPVPPVVESMTVIRDFTAPLNAVQVTESLLQRLLDSLRDGFLAAPDWLRQYLQEEWTSISKSTVVISDDVAHIGDWIVEDEWGTVHLVPKRQFYRRFKICGH